MLDIEFDKATSVHPAISIEFSDEFMRLMQFENRKHNVFELRAFAEVPIPPNAIKDGVITDPPAIADLIQQALETAKPKQANTAYAICLLPQEYSFFFTIELPGVSKEELRSIITREVNDILPMPVSEVYWDWHRIGTKNNRTQIQLASVPRKIIDSYMDTITRAKLIPLLFEPNTLASARLVANVDPQLGKMSILVNSMHSYYTVSLIADDEVLFSSEVRTQQISAKESARSVSRKITEVINYSAPQPKRIEEVPILVYGRNPGVQELIANLQELGIKNASRINYQIEEQTSGNYLNQERKDEYIALMGGALRGIGRDRNSRTTLNLVPQAAKEAFKLRELTNMLRRYLFFVAINITLLVVLVLLVNMGLQTRVSDVNEQYEAVINLSKSAKVKEIEQAITSLNTNSSQVRTLIESIYHWDKLFDLLRAVTPSTITLHNLTVAQDAQNTASQFWVVTITGIASDRHAVINMVERLRSDELLTDVKLPLGSLATENNASFTIEAKLPFTSLLGESTSAQ